MTGIILLTTVGDDAGPFNLYSNTSVPEFSVPFGDLYITAEQLLAGYVTDQIPDGTTTIRIKSINVNCTNYIDISIPACLINGNAQELFTPTSCYKFEPEGSYLLSFINKSDGGYYYGAFTGYSESGVITDSSYLIKLNEDLTIDTSFDPGTSFNDAQYTGSSIIEQSDGKIIVTGTFTTYQGVGANRIIRLNSDGTRDNTFVIGSGFDWYTQVPAIDSLGRIIVTGLFYNYNGNPAPRIARLLSDGTFDPTLVTGSGFNSTTTSALANVDNSLIVGGYFGSYNGINGLGGIIKLNTNGTRDTSFASGTGFSPAGNYLPIYTTRILGEDSFYATGYFTSYNGISANRIIKLNQDGTRDTSFDYGTGFDDGIYITQVIWDDKLFIAGFFKTYNGVDSYNYIILNADGSVLASFDINLYDSELLVSGTSDNGGLIRVTTATPHGFETDDYVYIYGVEGTTNANGEWYVTVISPNIIELQESVYDAAYISGGQIISDVLIVPIGNNVFRLVDGGCFERVYTYVPTTTSTTTTYVCPNCISGADVLIGTQEWTNCNLDVSTYANGDPIDEVTDTTLWAGLTTGAWCYYDNNSVNGPIRGKLYNWYAVNDPRGLAPIGYHVPSIAEFTQLNDYLDAQLPTGNVGGKMKATGTIEGNDGCWSSPNTGATNSSGFKAIPGGLRIGEVLSNPFIGIDEVLQLWSSTENDINSAKTRLVNNANDNLGGGNYGKKYGFSVRLIKD